MLVLTRSPDQQILFPNLGVSVRVLRVQGRSVRLGIEAPDDVKILRPDKLNEEDIQALLTGDVCHIDRHTMRNELNTLNLFFSLLQRHLAAGNTELIDKTIGQILQKLFFLDGVVAGPNESQQSVTQDRRLRLLLVEDDANERELLADLLRLYDFDVDTAGDGKDALDYLASHQPPDFVLLDMRMPNCDGRVTLQGIRESLRLTDLPVFAVSGSSPASMGIEDESLLWFPKPLDTDRLVRAMTESVGFTQSP